MCIEIIATCIADVETSVAAGVDRIELVSALTQGGLTPSFALMEEAVRVAKSVPVMVMIRPHAMSFVLMPDDIRVMEKEIQIAKKIGAAGIVLGGITAAGEIDTELLDRLLPLTDGLMVTFHKAFDRTRNVYEALDVILKYPQITRILTSGGMESVIENMPVLKELRKRAGGNVSLLPGGEMALSDISAIRIAEISTEIHLGLQVREKNDARQKIDAEKIKQAIALWK